MLVTLTIKGLNFSMSIKKCSTHLSSLEGDVLVTGCSCGRNQHNNNSHNFIQMSLRFIAE